ncbi:hypothetical protein PENSUB_839 [Penicillium subrubescens]|uniref:Uncharacterized protein n=1 Tax=Penicillium subrubescens TaxID=1316194 RepID=A0A1Q5UMC2_9EURO|nr:hypothetical protein PENSUB_839 [Penicillium subrubescens]
MPAMIITIQIHNTSRINVPFEKALRGPIGRLEWNFNEPTPENSADFPVQWCFWYSLKVQPCTVGECGLMGGAADIRVGNERAVRIMV